MSRNLGRELLINIILRESKFSMVISKTQIWQDSTQFLGGWTQKCEGGLGRSCLRIDLRLEGIACTIDCPYKSFSKINFESWEPRI